MKSFSGRACSVFSPRFGLEGESEMKLELFFNGSVAAVLLVTWIYLKARWF